MKSMLTVNKYYADSMKIVILRERAYSESSDAPYFFDLIKQNIKDFFSLTHYLVGLMKKCAPFHLYIYHSIIIMNYTSLKIKKTTFKENSSS